MVVNSMMMEHVQLIKNLLQDLQIAKSYEHAEEILSDPRQSETIYQFIEQRGGINEIKVSQKPKVINVKRSTDVQSKTETIEANPSEEVVSMLRESHELMKKQNTKLELELEDLKEKHAQEIKSMKENYERLKQSIQFIHGNMN